MHLLNRLIRRDGEPGGKVHTSQNMPKRLGLDELSDLKAALTGVEAKLTAAVDAAPTEPLAGAVREVIADLPNLRTCVHSL